MITDAEKERYWRCASVKLSHHGSSTSTPIELLQMFQPRSIIISAGTDHHHPSWELLLWLWVWLGVREMSNCVFTTCYPYYFFVDTGEAATEEDLDFSIASLVDSNSAVAKFRLSLLTLLTKIPGTEQANSLAKYILDRSYPSEPRQWILSQLQKGWGKKVLGCLSDLEPTWSQNSEPLCLPSPNVSACS